MKGWKKAVLAAFSVLVAIVAIGLPAMVGIRPFIGPKCGLTHGGGERNKKIG